MRVAHALPAHDETRRIVRGRPAAALPRRTAAIGGIQAGNPFLPVVHAVAVGIGVIRRAVGGQAVLLEPGVGNDGSRRLIFISADVHRAADDARVAVQVGGAGDISIVAGIDAGGVGLQMEIAAPSRKAGSLVIFPGRWALVLCNNSSWRHCLEKNLESLSAGLSYMMQLSRCHRRFLRRRSQEPGRKAVLLMTVQLTRALAQAPPPMPPAKLFSSTQLMSKLEQAPPPIYGLVAGDEAFAKPMHTPPPPRLPVLLLTTQPVKVLNAAPPPPPQESLPARRQLLKVQ